ncbi:MAG: ferrous iron transport protein A, partial [Paramuribaculum sp.]|nr:ferrous iron transport protein A [Paramuribaculum sp.]
MRLSQLTEGTHARVIKILGHGAFRKRLIEMGFVKGRVVDILQQAPLNDPVKYSIMGYQVSLRRSEAAMIEVVEVDGDSEGVAGQTEAVKHPEVITHCEDFQSPSD